VHVLYGEWLHATHATAYDKLPDLFIVFDVFDRRLDAFLSRDKVESLLEGTSLKLVHLVQRGTIRNMEEVRKLVAGPSVYSSSVAREGVYLRYCEGGEVLLRAKVVRGDFKPGNESWGKGKMATNMVSGDV